MQNATIPLISGKTLEVHLNPSAPLFIMGANGSGKSALMNNLIRDNPESDTKYIAAHRQVSMENSQVGMTAPNFRSYSNSLQQWNKSPESRQRENSPDGRLQSVLYQLISAQNSWENRISNMAQKSQKDKTEMLPIEDQPIEKLNKLLSLAGLLTPIKYDSKNSRIFTRHENSRSQYGMDSMSDGERSAVLIAIEVLTAAEGSTLFIEEPERHLHRSIAVPFISALFAERKDCVFVIATHDVELPLANSNAQIIWVHSIAWLAVPDDTGRLIHQWDATLVEKDSSLPDEMKRQILGARKKVLFVEGKKQSLDLPLYSVLFPGISIRHVGSSSEVIKVVKGLREYKESHDAEAFGLIDGDGRDDVNRLKEDGIYALPVYSVESLYYCEDAISAVADSQALTRSNYDVEKIMDDAKSSALEILSKHSERMAARVCEQQARMQTEMAILTRMPRWEDIVEGQDSVTFPKSVSINYADELARYNQLVTADKLDEIVARYPVRETGICDVIAKKLRFTNRKDYEDVLVTQVREYPELAKSLKRRLKPLADAMAKAQCPAES